MTGSLADVDSLASLAGAHRGGTDRASDLREDPRCAAMATRRSARLAGVPTALRFAPSARGVDRPASSGLPKGRGDFLALRQGHRVSY
jgi:hypothetical protein